jgi:hypothetical protein
LLLDADARKFLPTVRLYAESLAEYELFHDFTRCLVDKN